MQRNVALNCDANSKTASRHSSCAGFPGLNKHLPIHQFVRCAQDRGTLDFPLIGSRDNRCLTDGVFDGHGFDFSLGDDRKRMGRRTLQQDMTVDRALEMPFYHPVVEEGIRTALRGLAHAIKHADVTESDFSPGV